VADSTLRAGRAGFIGSAGSAEESGTMRFRTPFPRRSANGVFAAGAPAPVLFLIAAMIAAGSAAAQPPGMPFGLEVPASVGRASENFVAFDALYMQRNSDQSLAPRTLVMNGNTQGAAIASGDLRFPVAPGYRFLIGTHATEGLGWEIGSLGVYSMFADAFAAGPDSLQIPPPLGEKVSSLRNAAFAGATCSSALNSVEVSAVLMRQRVHLPHYNAYAEDAIGHSVTVDWLTGFRWAGLEESAGLALGSDPASLATVYSARTSSNLFGWQLGARGRVDWERWALEGAIKGAVAGAAVNQSQSPIVNTITGEVFRPAGAGQTANVGGIFELGTSLVYRLSDVWGLRVGYSMLWLTGVALAPNQFDFANSQAGVTTVDTNNTLWLGGGSLGLEARW
jgi:hypothetical protein